MNYDSNIKYKTIKDWNKDERPRERLVIHGARSLSNTELLAILISGGTTGRSAIELARELLDLHHDLNGLVEADYSSYKSVKGIGDAKAVTLAAAFELVKRIRYEPFSNKKIIRNANDVANLFVPKFIGDKTEKFYVLVLNTSNQILREILVSEGTLNASIVHPREVFKKAITESGASIMLLHNHPSGNPTPSNEDIKITKQLVSAGKLLDINVLDHIIIAGEQYSSLLELGHI